MNIETIKLNFINFLEDKLSGTKSDNSTEHSLFFDYFDDFKNTTDLDINLDETDLETIYNEFVNSKTSEEFNPSLIPEEANTEDLTEILLQDMLNDEIVVSALDLNNDNKLDNSEIEQFKKYIQGDDGKLTEEEIKKAYEEIKNNEFSYDEATEDTDKTEEIVTPKQQEDLNTEEVNKDNTTKKAKNASSSSGSSGSGGIGGGYTGGSTGVAETSSNTDTSTNSSSQEAKGETVAELEVELKEKKDKLSTEQSNLESIANGTNSELSDLQQQTDKSYEEYQNALKNSKSEHAKELSEVLGKITTKESNINSKEAEIISQTNVITNKQIEYNTAVINYKTKQSELESLKSKESSATEEEKESINSQILTLEGEVEAALKEKNQAEADLKEANDKKTALEEELETIKNEGETLEELKTKKEELETKVVEADPTVKAAMETYNANKENFENRKVELKSEAQKAVDTAKSEVDKVNTKLIEAKKEELKTKEDNQTTQTSANGVSVPNGIFKGTLTGQEQLVTKLANKYNVDPILVASVIALESGWGGSKLAQHNNFMGLRSKKADAGHNDKGFGYFSTVEKGLEAGIKNLAGYAERFSDVNAVDINNIDAIGKHYCSGNVWAGKIKNIYQLILKKMA